MGLFDGKKGVVFGIANERSIAWAITQQLFEQGAEIGFTHLPDKDPERPKNANKVRKLVEPLGAKFVVPCDVQKDEDLSAVFAKTAATYMGEFEQLLQQAAQAPNPAAAAREFLLSDRGKVYTMLAHASGRVS